MATRGMSKAELNQQMASALKKAVDYTVEQIQEENWHKVMEIVYDAYFPSDYDRTYEFADKAWVTESNSRIEPNGASSSGALKYDGSKLSSHRGDGFGQHMGFDDQECRMYLAEIIYEGMAGDFTQSSATGTPHYARDNPVFQNQAWTKKRNAWEALNKWLTPAQLKRIFNEGLTKAGLTYKSGAAIKKVVK